MRCKLNSFYKTKTSIYSSQLLYIKIQQSLPQHYASIQAGLIKSQQDVVETHQKNPHSAALYV